MLATIRDREGQGDTALYVRLRDARGYFWEFAARDWVPTETDACRVFLREIPDTDSTDSRYSALITLPSSGQAVVEYMRASDNVFLSEEDWQEDPTSNVMLASIVDVAGKGDTAIYVRLRDSRGRYWDFVNLGWGLSDTANARVFLPEHADPGAGDSRYSAEIPLPRGDGIAEYVYAATSEVIAEATWLSVGLDPRESARVAGARIVWPPQPSPVATYVIAKASSPMGPWSLAATIANDLRGPNFVDDVFVFTDPVGTWGSYYRITAVEADGTERTPSIVSAPGFVRVDQDFGGRGTLVYRNANGTPIEGATIRVFTPGTSEPIAVTQTDRDGAWLAPVFLNPGRTYIVQFVKPASYGPDAVTLVV